MGMDKDNMKEATIVTGCDFNRRKSVEEEKAKGYVGILLDLAAFNLRDGYFHLEALSWPRCLSLRPLPDVLFYFHYHPRLRGYLDGNSLVLVPLIQGFEDARDFSVTERLKTSLRVNLVFYLVVGSIGLVGLILLISMNRNWFACLSLLIVTFLCFNIVLLICSWMLIKVAQATSNQMSKRDPLRPYMDVIDNMLTQMYYRNKSEYMTYVTEALQLEDTVKNYERCNSIGWKYVLGFRSGRFGKMGMPLDKMEFIWLCILRKQLRNVLAIVLGIMFAAILLAEATLLPIGVDLSIFSILIYSVKKQEVLVQVFAFIPLMYMMVARYAPPISYNFLNLINRGGKKTIFEKVILL
ncbi:LMBR1-like membrane protein isoform 2 [Gossypium australe]|uniref:LMBR1-like membrane protein isoform 2 n=1 Tax=Gossypium australe TaxID=47621 RepID=A0A5B6UXD0_9ROSI|nr:LMBR1-like membrane protein isoform 2 [Gossypium australe]